MANRHNDSLDADKKVVENLRNSLRQGRDWPIALLEAIANWSTPHETYKGRFYNYFIGGEAFDWLTLAERLYHSAYDLILTTEWEDLLFEGRFPKSFNEKLFKDLLGVDKYRGYLNFFYGVSVEEALQIATEREVHKRHLGNGNQYQGDFYTEVFLRIYRSTEEELLTKFRQESGKKVNTSTSLTEHKEFMYWLFLYRIRTSDKAKAASDTNKGLEQLTSVSSQAWIGESNSLADLIKA